jgi:hypothetical protein
MTAFVAGNISVKSCRDAIHEYSPSMNSIDDTRERHGDIAVSPWTGGTDRGNDTDRYQGFGRRVGVARIIVYDRKGKKCNAGASSLYVRQNDATAS